MLEHQRRVLEEKNMLSEKIDKLNNYIRTDDFCLLSDTEKILLKRQLKIMCNYLDILHARINIFRGE